MKNVAQLKPAPTPAEVEENHAESLRIAEAVLFAASEPVSTAELARFLPDNANMTKLLETLKEHYAQRGINLVQVADKFMFRTAEDLRFVLKREQKSPRKLSRAALETLAIIAYHEPVTRAEIQEIRGVQFFSKGVMEMLLEIGWIKICGRKQIPGRPVTYGVTETFLTHFGLQSAKDLPGLEEMREAGLLSAMPPTMTEEITDADNSESEEEATESP